MAELGKVVKETTNISAKENFVLLRNEAAEGTVLQKIYIYIYIYIYIFYFLNRRRQAKLEFQHFHD